MGKVLENFLCKTYSRFSN